MIRYIFTVLLFFISGTVLSQIRYVIEGTTNEKELEGKKVYLYMVEEDNRLADSTIVMNRKFHFEGEVLRPSWACVRDSITSGHFKLNIVL